MGQMGGSGLNGDLPPPYPLDPQQEANQEASPNQDTAQEEEATPPLPQHPVETASFPGLPETPPPAYITESEAEDSAVEIQETQQEDVMGLLAQVEDSAIQAIGAGISSARQHSTSAKRTRPNQKVRARRRRAGSGGLRPW